MADKKTACFTGHRPPVLGGGYDEDTPTKQAVRKFLKDIVGRLGDDGFKNFVSGGALGVDQWAAEAVLECGFELTMAIPHDGYDAKWPRTSRDRYNSILKNATNVVIVAPGPYAPWKNHARNQWLVDNSELVVAVWNGSKDGGTASCVRYATKEGRRIIRFNPTNMEEEPISTIP